MVWHLLRSLFPADTLTGVTGERRVSLEGRIASENTLVGPISGMPGAAIELAIFLPVLRRAGRTDEHIQMEFLTSKVYAPAQLLLQCEGGALEVPLRAARYRFPGGDYGIPIDKPLPAEFDAALRSKHYDGAIHARESILAKGHRVHVRGKVFGGERVNDASGYRGVETLPMFTAKDVIITDKSI
jgi:hypothetical protein